MRKIIIIGCPGAGKSYFAKKLHSISGIPLYHLDMIWHRKDKTHLSRTEFDEQLKKILQEKTWIIDGNYSRTMELRMQACDTIIFFDVPYEVCIEGVHEREGKKQDDMPWDATNADESLLETIRNYIPTQRPKVYCLLEKYKQKKKIFIFKTREEGENWLNEISSEE